MNLGRLTLHKCESCGKIAMRNIVGVCGCGGWFHRHEHTKPIFSVVRFASSVAVVELRECDNGELEVSEWIKHDATPDEVLAVMRVQHKELRGLTERTASAVMEQCK